MATPVAIKGDTQAKTSSAKDAKDTSQSGAWGSTFINVTSGKKCKVNGKPVELEATAGWIYKGGIVKGPPDAPIPPFSDDASLKAGSSKLKDGGKNILVDGNKAQGKIDPANQIGVWSSQSKLKIG